MIIPERKSAMLHGQVLVAPNRSWWLSRRRPGEAEAVSIERKNEFKSGYLRERVFSQTSIENGI
jgi:hypothetical protein